eukprot:181641-Amorphochlora_amoeboformis.AAC.1
MRRDEKDGNESEKRKGDRNKERKIEKKKEERNASHRSAIQAPGQHGPMRKCASFLPKPKLLLISPKK